ncbi:MAG: hypothetical protein AABY03_01540, partial [Nanoarchaeota archaeon]
LSRDIKKLQSKINKELNKLESIKQKFILNEYNEKLLGSFLSKIVKFKMDLLDSWKQKFSEEKISTLLE